MQMCPTGDLQSTTAGLLHVSINTDLLACNLHTSGDTEAKMTFMTGQE